jgi:hypothetical protein
MSENNLEKENAMLRSKVELLEERLRNLKTMSSEDKTWVVWWVMVGAVFISMITGVSYNSYTEKQTRLEALKRGVDPIEYACAFGSHSYAECKSALARESVGK